MCPSLPPRADDVPAPWTADAAHSGQRLDAALAAWVPALSLRARRRLWDSHEVLVNGRARPCGFVLREGDELCLRPRSAAGESAAEALAGAAGQSPEEFPAGAAGPAPNPEGCSLQSLPDRSPEVLAVQENLVFLYKPRGLHSCALQGRGGPSLEALLPALQAGVASTAAAPGEMPFADSGQPASPWQLVNRLDCGTSGIVVAARSPQGAAQWRRMEDAGLCEKHYIAILCGILRESRTVRRRLDTNQRRISRVLAVDTQDTLRHTRFTPLASLPSGWWPGSQGMACTLALCSIAKGARHQIRAHAAHLAFPLWGDRLYKAQDGPWGPGETEGTEGDFLLHHAVLALPASRIRILPPWLDLLPPAVGERVREQVLA